MSSKFKKKILKGFFWQGINQFGIQFITIICGIVLLRLLEPADYGWMGMIMVFYGFSQVLIDGGFGAALIQKKDVTQTDLSTIFWINIFIGIILFLLGLFLAPLIANFYGETRLEPLARYLAIGFVIASLNIIQRTILQKELNFKLLSALNLFAFLGSQIIAIWMAVYGYGVWSLVAAQLSNYSIAALGLWIFNKWRPSFVFSIASLKSLYRFSMDMLGHRSLNVMVAKLDKVYVGKVLGDQVLGHYENAYRLMIKPIMSISRVFFNVLFPSFSKLEKDSPKINTMYLEAMILVSFLTFPLLMGLCFSSEVVILSLFGEKWSPMIPLFQLFCLQGLVLTISPISSGIMFALGESRLVLKYNVISQVQKITLFLILGYYFGVIGVASALVINAVIIFFLRQRAINNRMGIAFFKHYGPMAKNLLIGGLIGGGIFSINFLAADINLYVKLGIIAISWVLLFISTAYLFNKHLLLRVISLLQVMKSRKKKES